MIHNPRICVWVFHHHWFDMGLIWVLDAINARASGVCWHGASVQVEMYTHVKHTYKMFVFHFIYGWILRLGTDAYTLVKTIIATKFLFFLFHSTSVRFKSSKQQININRLVVNMHMAIEHSMGWFRWKFWKEKQRILDAHFEWVW